MKIDFNTINHNTNLGLLNKEAILHYMTGAIEFLESHNKNYTKKQYELICDLKEIITNIKE